MAIRIITDSTSDIPFEQQASLGIEIVPLSVRFGSEEYIDGVTLSKPQFFQKLAECEELPTTAQVNPEKFAQIFRKYGEDDEIIGIFISGELSGTFQSSVIAKGIVNSEKIHLIDSRTVTFGLALLVYEAVRMRDAGHSAAEICEAIQSLTGRLKFYAVVDTLKYLKMGGRLSASSALLGTMLRIKPIISLQDGKVEAVDKKQGLKAAVQAIAQKVKAERPDPSYQIVLGDSNAPSLTAMFKEALAGDIDIAGSALVELGAVVGTHAGPGCAGLAYIMRADR
jgi:DegV family protein with EDD domain